MTTNTQLQKYINNNKPYSNQNFLGVFASDQLPVIATHNACLIVNYSPSTISDHGHWCAMLYLNTPNKSPYWFDSFGFKPDYDDHNMGVQTHFKKYLLKYSGTTTYLYNKFDFQGYSNVDPKYTDVCGEYSVTAITHGQPNNNVPIWNQLLNSKSTLERDKIIKEFCKIRNLNSGS